MKGKINSKISKTLKYYNKKKKNYKSKIKERRKKKRRSFFVQKKFHLVNIISFIEYSYSVKMLA